MIDPYRSEQWRSQSLLLSCECFDFGAFSVVGDLYLSSEKNRHGWARYHGSDYARTCFSTHLNAQPNAGNVMYSCVLSGQALTISSSPAPLAVSPATFLTARLVCATTAPEGIASIGRGFVLHSSHARSEAPAMPRDPRLGRPSKDGRLNTTII